MSKYREYVLFIKDIHGHQNCNVQFLHIAFALNYSIVPRSFILKKLSLVTMTWSRSRIPRILPA